MVSNIFVIITPKIGEDGSYFLKGWFNSTTTYNTAWLEFVSANNLALAFHQNFCSKFIKLNLHKCWCEFPSSWPKFWDKFRASDGWPTGNLHDFDFKNLWMFPGVYIYTFEKKTPKTKQQKRISQPKVFQGQVTFKLFLFGMLRAKPKTTQTKSRNPVFFFFKGATRFFTTSKLLVP